MPELLRNLGRGTASNVTDKAKQMKSKVMEGDGLLGIGIVSKIRSKVQNLGNGKLLSR